MDGLVGKAECVYHPQSLRGAYLEGPNERVQFRPNLSTRLETCDSLWKSRARLCAKSSTIPLATYIGTVSCRSVTDVRTTWCLREALDSKSLGIQHSITIFGIDVHASLRRTVTNRVMECVAQVFEGDGSE